MCTAGSGETVSGVIVAADIDKNQGCELELELKELGNFGRTRTRTRKIKISELELELELEKSLWNLSSFNE